MTNSEYPFFSICIPTYNSVFYLKRLLNSLFFQSFSDFEIIISDDSTSDEVEKFCLALNNEKIKYQQHKSLYCATENWNYALKNASGKYRMLVHHDDYFYDENILAQIHKNCINFDSIDAYFLGFKNDTHCKKFYYNRFNFQSIQENPSNLLFVNYLSAPSCLVLRESVKLNYDTHLKWLVDVEFYQRLFDNYSSIGYLPEIKMVIGGGDERITNTISRKDILSEFFYLRKKKIYKSGFAIYLIKFIKTRIILIEFLKFKINGFSK